MTPADLETSDRAAEVASGQRFEFGKNWASFLKTVDDQRIVEAMKSLASMLGTSHLEGKTFLDVGSGSGLFSLAARFLGASVHSFDYDPDSVGCARELKRRYFPIDRRWTIEEGSVLNQAYLSSLGQFDIVYSWGVLHHTGQLWTALENVGNLVAPNGSLFIAIYNDEGAKSVRWRKVKELYNHLPRMFRFSIILPFACLVLWRPLIKSVSEGHPFQYFRDYKKRRGMSVWHDIFDWLGGLPFEVARPEMVFNFYKARSFMLDGLTTDGGSGCNQFLFIRRNPNS
jgi:2-polyprenyl-3-methyl-5-hydroxy-6-metoxy-1,4-benzoquinol methylase